LVDEEHVAEEVPAVSEQLGFAALDADGAVLGEGSELRAASRSALQPYY
jgi:hypothetical protein